MHSMPENYVLSELQERILHTLWRLRGIGNRGVKEQIVKEDVAHELPIDGWTEEIQRLCQLGFLDSEIREESSSLSLTLLGLSVLRQLNEDKLEELK